MEWLPELPFDVNKVVSSEVILNIGASLIRMVFILLVAFVATKIIGRIVRLFGDRVRKQLEQNGDESRVEREKRVETLSRVLRLTVNITIWAVAFMLALREIGYDVGPLIAGAGVVGLAIGFGAQNLVRDVITGLFLLLENQVRVGDVAVINGQGGLVEEVNLRTIVLRDVEGTVHVFPNGVITALANKTRGFSCYVFDIGVAYKEDTDRVVALLRQVSAELKEDPDFGPDMLDNIEIFGVDKFADSAVVIKGRVRTKVGAQWKIGREANRRIKKIFDAEGVEIPFPHMSLYTGDATKPFPLELGSGSEELIRKVVREELERHSGKAAADAPRDAPE
ncbi:MAG: mechanosensitive ion channel family protein [Acidobacteria bacterium]|nr:mechanosensitive ion channel family protein [Acidobacteriota bacterium]